VAAVLALATFLVLMTNRAELAKLEVTKLPGRAAWQLPDRVVDALDLTPGDHVADVGAGDGFFVFHLADAVGPAGRVYAVEVEEEKVRELERRVREKGYENVEVVLGELGDPLLPDGAIDLVLLCNVYHHIEDRHDYFLRLQADLRSNGRVAVVEPRELGGWIGWIEPPGHSTPIEVLDDEMGAVGYRLVESFDFLPVQSFVIFTAARPGNGALVRSGHDVSSPRASDPPP
jgi:SAM-dependent methyltransferase